jgi:predicted nucleotidyltransferase
MREAVKIVKEIIKNTMQKNKITIKQVILFGSRVRDDFREDSDWDFLVIVDKELSFNEKWDIIDEIKRKLAKLGIPNDVIIKSEKDFEVMKKCPGVISYTAAREGVIV